MLRALKLRKRNLDACSKQQKNIVLERGVFEDRCDRILQDVWKGEEKGCSAQSDWKTFALQAEVMRTPTGVW